MKIHILGNPFIKIDSLPLKLIPKLKQEFPDIEFVEYDPTEEIETPEEFIIIDTVLDIEKVIVFEDIDKIQTGKVCSLHDYDLGMHLKLLKKLNKLKSIKIIGVPPDIEEKEALNQIKEIISSLS